MEQHSIFNRTFSVLEKSLDLRALKHRAVVSNIANMDTPNYKAFDLEIKEAFEKFQTAGKPLALDAPCPGHIRQDPAPAAAVTYRIVNSDPVRPGSDGNTVDLDRSMAEMSENALLYNTSAQIIRNKFKTLKEVIQGGGK